MREASVNVRTLVEFSCLTGDIVPAGRALRRMREGAQAHIALQREYDETFRSEVPVSRTMTIAGMKLTVQGRIDGLSQDNFGPVIEEIKSTDHPVESDFGGTQVHWMQAIVYAAIVAHQQGAEFATVQLVYVYHGEITRLTRQLSAVQLEETLFSLADAYVQHSMRLMDAHERAQQSAQMLPFPFADYRSGQRQMVKHAYFALTHGRKLMAQAPTGVGKTMAALYPAVRALGTGAFQRIFYLTARTTQRTAAENALERMRGMGLYLRSVTITAKDKICPFPDCICSGDSCPYAQGYFDRIGQAIREGLGIQRLDREGILSLAERHRVCPFEMSLDLAELAEAVICDYNYAFDPNVRLKRFFDGKNSGGVLLIDEAHHLPDRVSDMLSARIDTRDVKEARRLLGKQHGRKSPAYIALTALLRALEQESDGHAEPFVRENASEAVRKAVSEAVAVLRDAMPFDETVVTDHFFAWMDAERVIQHAAAEHTCALIEPQKKGCSIKLWRFDPSAYIRDTMKKASGTLMFSATLTPVDYYARLCGVDIGGEDAALAVESPFPPENRLVLRAAVPMKYQDREKSVPAVVEYLHAMVSAKIGNYMACCPSYALLGRIADAFEAAYPDIEVLRQRGDMDDAARAELLEQLQADPRQSKIAFVVMGGAFSEGIDLPGDRLSGAAILSVGIPQISFERDVLAQQESPAGGYNVAYVYPSVVRVAQAAGRVIRTETDRGVILLIDDRFGREPYRSLYGGLWRSVPVKDAAEAETVMRQFWCHPTAASSKERP